jgi:hypothetical protein
VLLASQLAVLTATVSRAFL